MADQQPSQNPGVKTNTFSKGMVKDYNETFIGEGLYTHARNAVNNSHDGQIGVIGNEPSNIFCVKLPYSLIGSIHLYDDQWVVFTTNDIDSEIGIFDESACTYTKVVNARCLNFKKSHLITGTFRYRYDCERIIYWDDSINPSRTMDIDNVPYIYTDKVVGGCIQRTYTDQLNCEAIRLASLIKYPCLKLSKGQVAGTLPNGTYQACIAYTINKVRVSDYIGLSEAQSLFTFQNISSSLQLEIIDIDRTFDEFELVLVTNINQQTVCKRLGYYSTVQGTIYIDRWDLEYVTIPISDVVLRTEAIEKTDAMYSVNNYLIRVGTYSKFKFNYQPIANQIKARWIAVEYPENYYIKGGNNTTYLRDEQYAFFIRWIYNTGERSESYHIPGRAATGSDNLNTSGLDAFETSSGVTRKKWQVENTATVTSRTTSILPDGGTVIASGQMGYWESTELYPADKPEIWGNLCGKPIRHHKMPDETTDPALINYNKDNNTIVLLGVQFDNIQHPLDQNGNPIESIVGYEILRGSREGNKSILGKGLFNNMREYNIPESTTSKGLYQNYPYNDLRPDGYLTSQEQTGENGPNSGNVTTQKVSAYRKDVFSFHSPETSFTNPYLNVNEVKLYQELSGTSTGRFEVPYKHPKFKLPSNFLDILLKVSSLIAAVSAAIGTTGADSTLTLPGTASVPMTIGLLAQHRPDLINGAWYGTTTGSLGNVGDVTPAGAASALAAAKRVTQNSAITTANAAMSIAMLPFTTKAIDEQLYALVLGIIPKVQYATQYVSHGFYDTHNELQDQNKRRRVIEANYVRSNIQQFTKDYQVNNLDRSGYVVVKIDGEFQNPLVQDTSRFIISERATKIYTSITSDICSYYGALKLSIPSQYGQLEAIKQISISECISSTVPNIKSRFSSPVFFGGDIYINRFTEKNSMLFFNNWLFDQPDNYEYNYGLYPSLPYPRFWVNSNSLEGGLFSLSSNRRSLDGIDRGVFYIKGGHFYLFNSGVRDFFVESEINLAYRDWEDQTSRRHYDPYEFTDLSLMFRSDIIRSGNFYKYDYSLSISKLVNSHITWGELLPKDYSPTIDATCYIHKPLRAIYSLPQQYESKKDSWRAFLANNYYDFDSEITSIKSINKTGALFMMKYTSPLSFMGVEELQMDGTNTKVTIGDGKLFDNNKQLQSIVNVDDSYEYGSCQGRYCTIGTLHGVFWVSQNQGKVFNYLGKLNEISNSGMKWWFAKYLPSQLLKVYPNYPLYDNPLKGVGVMTIYDNTNEIVYISKKDFKPLKETYTYDADGNFYDNGVKVEFTDSKYFEDASWTISYDPKTQTWISFHDWVPTFVIPGKNHFMSVNTDSIWKHNIRCDSYCNFYGIDYPFEIEFVSATGQQVNSMRSIEYLLEAYNIKNECRDKFHILDQNFDQAIIYNSEQISGLLKLNIKQKSNPLNLLNYPIINLDSIEIQFSKEENKYRFNQFWDITKDRGEFTGYNVSMFNTSPSGYKFDINPNYVNYDKDSLQRKKFRHTVNRVFLRKTKSDNVKILFKISNQKLLQSPR